jgi:hypothetical protein
MASVRILGDAYSDFIKIANILTSSVRQRAFLFRNFPYERVIKQEFVFFLSNDIHVSGDWDADHWPRGLWHEPPSPAATLGSWVRITLEA